MELEQVLRGYIDAALWVGVFGLEQHESGENVRDDFYEDEILPESLRAMRADCAAFIEETAPYHDMYLQEFSAEQFGYDFWLTRNRHGTGFWDRGLGVLGDLLSESAHVYGGAGLIEQSSEVLSYE